MIAAIYARKSTEQNGLADETKSVTRQVEHGRAYATKKGWTVADGHVYADDGISGAEFVNRPGFVRLMNALKPRAPFQVLIMSEESRLGREAIETAYALKRLVTAGVRVFFYLEDRERTLDSPTDKVLLSITTFADELERERARQRTHDAMVRKAKALHVTGGRVYGYDNVEVAGPDGRRQHVVRRVNPVQAAVIARIFTLCAAGAGFARIAKTLNADGVAPPRGASGWAPSAIREILLRRLYVGEVIYNRIAKRDQWGLKRYRYRPETEWIRREAPDLRVVSEELWQAAHARLERARAIYLRTARGTLMAQRSLRDADAAYLLSGLARCGACGGPLGNVTRDFRRQGRRHYYGCTFADKRGRTVCTNRLLIQQERLDAKVLAALRETLTEPVLDEVVRRTLARLREAVKPASDRRALLERELASVDQAIANLTDAVKAGRAAEPLLEALEAESERRRILRAALAGVEQQAETAALDEDELRAVLRSRVADLEKFLGRHVAQTRQVLRKLIPERLTCMPFDEGERRGYRFTAVGSYDRLLARPLNVVTPAGSDRFRLTVPLHTVYRRAA